MENVQVVKEWLLRLPQLYMECVAVECGLWAVVRAVAGCRGTMRQRAVPRRCGPCHAHT